MKRQEPGHLNMHSRICGALSLEQEDNLMNEFNRTDFTQLNKEEKLEILSWRNDESIRFNMFNSECINWEEHLNFIDSLKEDLTRKYYLVFKNDSPIGVVNLTSINYQEKSAEGGLYANPILIGTGIGSDLMDVLIEICNSMKLKKIYMRVKKNNIRALKLYQRFGFNIEGEHADYYITRKAL